MIKTRKTKLLILENQNKTRNVLQDTKSYLEETLVIKNTGKYSWYFSQIYKRNSNF